MNGDKIKVQPLEIKPFVWMITFIITFMINGAISLFPIGIFSAIFPSKLPYELFEQYRCIFFIIGGIIISTISFPLIHKRHKKTYFRNCWMLNNSNVYYGSEFKDSFPISSIEKIITKLPASICFHPITKAFRNSGIVIFLSENKILPLNILTNPDGTEFTKKLIELCKDKVIEEYKFSENEIKKSDME